MPAPVSVRPVPAFYCVYTLRSTVRHQSLYVGSTPDPARRLRQHNGIAKGGAVRTSRDSSRPWEMILIVKGFPSHIAALQFEWALQNPHMTRHIEPGARLTKTTAKKRNGRTKRPQYSLTSILSNLHLLLRVPSFARWPLELQFFSRDVHAAWVRWTTKFEAKDQLRDSLPVILTVLPVEESEKAQENKSKPDEKTEETETLSETERLRTERMQPPPAILALDPTYAPYKPHIAKSQYLLADAEDYEANKCAVCSSLLNLPSPNSPKDILATCVSPTCPAISHLTCLSSHFLTCESAAFTSTQAPSTSNPSSNSDEKEHLIPIKGHCPSCGVETNWVDVVRELSLRMRGEKETEKVLKTPRKKGGAAKAKTTKGAGKGKGKAKATEEDELSQADSGSELDYPSDEEMDDFYDIDDADMDMGTNKKEPVKKAGRGRPKGSTNAVSKAKVTKTKTTATKARKKASPKGKGKRAASPARKLTGKSPMVIEDSEADLLDEDDEF